MEKTFKTGELIIEENKPGNEAYIILSGSVEVYKTIKGRKTVFAVLGKDQIFGEMSMIDDRPRSATVKALEDTRVVMFTREKFNEVFYSEPRHLTVFLKCLFERMRNIDQQIIDLTIEKTANGSFSGTVRLTGLTEEAEDSLGREELMIGRFPFKIGRKTTAHMNDLFSHNDLLIEDNIPYNVSRNHVSLQVKKDEIYVIDRGSTLGTMINGE